MPVDCRASSSSKLVLRVLSREMSTVESGGGLHCTGLKVKLGRLLGSSGVSENCSDEDQNSITRAF